MEKVKCQDTSCSNHNTVFKTNCSEHTRFKTCSRSLMSKIFVSFSYIGSDVAQTYHGHDNIILDISNEPKDEESLEECTNLINEKTKEKNGFNGVTCTILFFKKI